MPDSSPLSTNPLALQVQFVGVTFARRGLLVEKLFEVRLADIAGGAAIATFAVDADFNQMIQNLNRFHWSASVILATDPIPAPPDN